MTTDTVPQTVLFPDLFDKPLFARFNQEQASSDGGAILLKAAERIYGLVKAFAGCLFDKRAPDKTRHSLADLIGQRIFGIACGHPDCNDGDRLAEDPIHKLLLDRDPVSGERLASQPTLSRFENAVNGCALYRMADELATRVIERHRRRLDGRGAVHHDRSGPDGRPDARGAAVHAVQRLLRQLVLPAAAWLPDLRPRIRAVSVRGAVAARQGGRLRGDGRAVVAVAAAAAPGVSAGAHSRSARRGLCQPGGLRLPGGAAAARLRGRDGEERGVGAVRRAGHAGGAGADVAQRTDRARLHRDQRVPGRHVEPRAAAW